jgi:hypothetical protein
MESLIHHGIKCDLCQKFPIVGIRYKCLQCKSYNLCEDCEKKEGMNHGHLLLKLRDNRQINLIGNNNLKKDIKLKSQPNLKPQSKCLNTTMRYKTVNNNNFITIPVKLMNNGKTNWPLPCFFTCDEYISKVKGERIKLGKINGLPGESVEFNLKLDLSSIKKTGDYSSVWSLRDENGNQFGQKFIFVINDTFKEKLELKPLYKIKKIFSLNNNETQPMTTAEYLAKKGIH